MLTKMLKELQWSGFEKTGKEYSKMAALRNFTKREKKWGAKGGNKVQRKF